MKDSDGLTRSGLIRLIHEQDELLAEFGRVLYEREFGEEPPKDYRTVLDTSSEMEAAILDVLREEDRLEKHELANRVEFETPEEIEDAITALTLDGKIEYVSVIALKD